MKLNNYCEKEKMLKYLLIRELEKGESPVINEAWGALE